MKEIKLDCFIANEFCQITSLDKSIKIDNPLEKEVNLEIFNHGTTDCVVKIKTTSLSVNDDLNFANLTISNSKQMLFKDSLQIFKETEITLGSVMTNSSANYLFSMDLLDLVLEGKKFAFNFDLIFDFACEDAEDALEKTDQIQQKIDSSSQLKETSVLSAKDTTKENTDSNNFLFGSPSFFLLLSILFVIIFFVIMKFIHEQKKKKHK